MPRALGLASETWAVGPPLTVWVGKDSITAGVRASPGRGGETGFRQNTCLCKGPGAVVGENGTSGTQRSERETGVGQEAPGAVRGRQDSLPSAVGGGVPRAGSPGWSRRRAKLRVRLSAATGPWPRSTKR